MSTIQKKLQDLKCSDLIVVWYNVTKTESFWESPRFAEEFVLDKNGKDEHHSSLNGHGKEIFSNHLPTQWILKTIFS